MKIALVSCTKAKENHACKARQMYMKSSLYSKAISYIESYSYDNWYILSAKYGLLEQDENKIFKSFMGQKMHFLLR